VMPELVAEVKTPSDSWPEVMIKVNDYLDAGIEMVLVLDPPTRTVIRYAKDREETIPTDGILTLPELFPDFSCPIANLFQ
jgi:Uma2 family endonuclease